YTRALKVTKKILNKESGKTWEVYFFKNRIYLHWFKHFRIRLGAAWNPPKEILRKAKESIEFSIGTYPYIPYFYLQNMELQYEYLNNPSKAFESLLQVLKLDSSCHYAYYEGAKMFYFLGKKKISQGIPWENVLPFFLSSLYLYFQALEHEPEMKGKRSYWLTDIARVFQSQNWCRRIYENPGKLVLSALFQRRLTHFDQGSWNTKVWKALLFSLLVRQKYIFKRNRKIKDMIDKVLSILQKANSIQGQVDHPEIRQKQEFMDISFLFISHEIQTLK
ncbi:MAG: hypothetical protein D6785_07455, partial [Planctomycetota bacterium]